jgi:hypothetical protein
MAQIERAVRLLDVNRQNAHRIVATKKLEQSVDSKGQNNVLQKTTAARDERTE